MKRIATAPKFSEVTSRRAARRARAEPGPIGPSRARQPDVVVPKRASEPGRPNGRARVFARPDWLAFLAATVLVLIGYFLTLAPEVTLEDSGEMAVAAQYAGVPHSPGYPVWTLYAWAFTKLLPWSNVAWRVAAGSAVAGALACGLVALMVSRGSRALLAQLRTEKPMSARWQSWFGALAGVASGSLLGFTGFVWSQAVIVEVYPLSLLSLTAMMASLFRWMHRPAERRYLYLAWFLFGICLNNHQSLVVAALAVEACVAMVDRRLGRELFLGNTVCYLAGCYAIHRGWMLEGNGPLAACFHAIGCGSITTWLALAWAARGAKSRPGPRWAVGPAAACGLFFLGGAVFYFWLPITSMTNPPMNWAYPRTVAGFFHALTRGQYESPHPVTSVARYAEQLWQLGSGAVDEFGAGLLILAVIPLLLLRRLAGPARAWLLGGVMFYLLLGPGLLGLLNPGTDRATLNLVRVFFGASHVMLAMAIGFGVALGAGILLHRQMPDSPGRTTPVAIGSLLGAALLASVVALLAAWTQTHLIWTRASATAGVGLAVGMILLAWRSRRTLSPAWALVLTALLPVPSIVSHWWSNEQHGHRFGYWYGHDMFAPPFRGADGRLTDREEQRAAALAGADSSLVYPAMARGAVLFGGTDPGRFCPTYMIFSESTLAPEQRADARFDRRDVHLITQNALADAHYLEYIRAHYQRSAQVDPYFFSELLRSAPERAANEHTNFLARLAQPLDVALTRIGARVEAERRARGIYPANELRLPSGGDLDRAMREFLADFQARAQRGQMRPGEDVRVDDSGRAQVTGQVAVMGINSILTRQIFDQNPEHEFFVEESFPIDWMYPHLTPYGTILKLEREAPRELSAAVVARDRRFWSDYLERLMGDWIKPETNIAEICAYAAQVHGRQELAAYHGDGKFIRDEAAQKAFSKLRSSIGGVYDWRFRNATGQLQLVTRRLSEAGLNGDAVRTLEAERGRLVAEQARMYVEAELALKQAYALSPESPEAMQRLVQLLLAGGRVDEAVAVAETSRRLDPRNGFYASVVDQLRRMKLG